MAVAKFHKNFFSFDDNNICLLIFVRDCTYTSVDYAGPVYINNIYIKLQTFKCWIV